MSDDVPAGHEKVYEHLSYAVLLDAVFDGGQQLFAPLAILNGDPDVQDLSHAERSEIAARVLLHLVRRGLIFLYRADPSHGTDRSFALLHRMPNAEAEAVVSNRGWTTLPLSADAQGVWFDATPAGREAANRRPRER